jgi:hypothetical protein
LVYHRRGKAISEYFCQPPRRLLATRFGGTSEQVERWLKTGSQNMRASTAYFAGAGTVIAAIVAGVGGGLVIADMISPKSAKQGTKLSRLERRMSPEPIQAASGPSEPVQYLATPQLSASVPPVAAAPAQAQAEAVSSESTRAQAAIAPPAVSQAAASAAQPAAREQTAVPDDAFATNGPRSAVRDSNRNCGRSSKMSGKTPSRDSSRQSR